MNNAEPQKTILIVDDDSAIRQVVEILLIDFGTVEMAVSGEEAIQKAQNLIPDLIILDVQMPGMDGYETCERLKGNDKTADIPVIFLTASNLTKDEERGLEVGATDFIRKPISRKIFTSRVSNILDLQTATRKLEMLASTDPLTGAYNRRHFIKTGDNEILRSRRYKYSFTVLMLDIDHFKAVNDIYGHGIGDVALIQTVSTIQGALRSEDTLGRFGGEEFAVILPQTDKAHAAVLAERIRLAISRIVIDTPADPLIFTISIGMAENIEDDTDISDLLKRADEALYQAKEQGRNQVV